MKYYKITNEEENHRGLQYQTGLNVDPAPFNDDPTASCVEGGIYFSDAENIFAFVSYGPWIREVTIPEGARMIKDPDFGPTKYRADRVILGERRKWKDVDTLKELINEGVDIHAREEYALSVAAHNGHLETVRYLVEQGADIHAYNDEALCGAAEYGHLEVVQYLVEQGADIYTKDDYALRWAAECGYLEVVRYLVEHGANIHAQNDYALRWAKHNGYLDVVRYLKSKMLDT